MANVKKAFRIACLEKNTTTSWMARKELNMTPNGFNMWVKRLDMQNLTKRDSMRLTAILDHLNITKEQLIVKGQ